MPNLVQRRCLLALLLLWSTAVGCRGTLVCSTRDAAVGLIASALAQSPGAAFVTSRIAPAALTDRAALTQLLTNELHVLRDATDVTVSAADDDDVRRLIMPSSWVSALGAPLAVNTDASAWDTAACTAAMAAADSGALPPPEVRDVLQALIDYGTLLATDRICTGANQVQVGADGVYACACADASSCLAEDTVDNSLLQTVLGLEAALLSLVLLAVAVVVGAMLITRERARV